MAHMALKTIRSVRFLDAPLRRVLIQVRDAECAARGGGLWVRLRPGNDRSRRQFVAYIYAIATDNKEYICYLS
jgi:hypothetical protein